MIGGVETAAAKDEVALVLTISVTRGIVTTYIYLRDKHPSSHAHYHKPEFQDEGQTSSCSFLSALSSILNTLWSRCYRLHARLLTCEQCDGIWTCIKHTINNRLMMKNSCDHSPRLALLLFVTSYPEYLSFCVI